MAGNVLRRFELQKGETASYIPRSTFPDRMQADAQSFIRCSGNTVVVYSNPAKILIEISSKTETPRMYHITAPQGLEATGFAVTNSGDAYGMFDNFGADDGREGMYALLLDRGMNRGNWKPVKGAVGNLGSEDVVSRVWGAEGDTIVLIRSTDELALNWVTISPK
jgi:hypothetical protein